MTAQRVLFDVPDDFGIGDVPTGSATLPGGYAWWQLPPASLDDGTLWHWTIEHLTEIETEVFVGTFDSVGEVIARADANVLWSTAGVGVRETFSPGIKRVARVMPELSLSLKERVVSFELNTDTDLTPGDGKRYWRVPLTLAGYNLVSVGLARVSGTGIPSIQIHNLTQAVDMLSTNVTIDSGETDSRTATTPVVIDTANDDVAEGDRLRVDVDAAGTSTRWCELQLGFALPD